MEFRAEVEQTGRTTTGIEVPPEVVESLGGGKRPKVSVTLNGKTYRSSIASMVVASWSGSVRRTAP